MCLYVLVEHILLSPLRRWTMYAPLCIGWAYPIISTTCTISKGALQSLFQNSHHLEGVFCSCSSGFSPPWLSQLSNILPTSLKLTGFVMKRSTPLVNASAWSLLLAKPVSAMMRTGLSALPRAWLWVRASSISRMARVASNPFMTGIEISIETLEWECIGARKRRITHKDDVIAVLMRFRSLHS